MRLLKMLLYYFKSETTTPAPTNTTYILTESGNIFLTENGNRILQE